MSINNGREPKKPRKTFKKMALFIAILLIGCFGWLILNKQVAFGPGKEAGNLGVEPQGHDSSKQQENKKAELQPLQNIQPQIDNFVATHQGVYGIKIVDDTGSTLAKINDEKQFFTASLYKLFVAYVGYQRVDSGKDNFNDMVTATQTREQCLDAMIRSSDSVCGEAMMHELNDFLKPEKLMTLGINNTSIGGLTTTAKDTAILLQKISTGDGLSDKSKNLFLDSMKSQDSKYRLGLPSGFKNSVVYNKVGWNENKEWHDASIVKLKNGREVMIAVLSDGAGYRNIASLGSVIEKALE